MMYYEDLGPDYTEEQLTEFANLEDFSNDIELRPSLNTEKSGNSSSISLSIGGGSENDLEERSNCHDNHEIKHDSATSSSNIKTSEQLSGEPNPEDLLPSAISDKYPDSEKNPNNSPSKQSHDLNFSIELNEKYESSFEFVYKNSSVNSKETQAYIENKQNVIREFKKYLDYLFPSMDDLFRFLISMRHRYCFDINHSQLIKLLYIEYHPEKYILDRYSDLGYDKCMFKQSYKE